MLPTEIRIPELFHGSGFSPNVSARRRSPTNSLDDPCSWVVQIHVTHEPCDCPEPLPAYSAGPQLKLLVDNLCRFLNVFDQKPDRPNWLILQVTRSQYSLLHFECHLITISNLNFRGLFSTERVKRDQENQIIDWDLRLKKCHFKCNRLCLVDIPGMMFTTFFSWVQHFFCKLQISNGGGATWLLNSDWGTKPQKRCLCLFLSLFQGKPLWRPPTESPHQKHHFSSC